MQMLGTKGICISLMDQFHVDTPASKVLLSSSESRPLFLPSVASCSLICRAEWYIYDGEGTPASLKHWPWIDPQPHLLGVVSMK